MLELFLLNYGIKPIFYESEYNKYYEEVMFPNPELETFSPDLIFICTSTRNICVYPDLSDNYDMVSQKLNMELERYENIWRRIAQVYNCPIIQNNFELPYYRLMGNRDASDYHGKVNFIGRLNMLLNEYSQKHKDFYVHDIHYASSVYGLDKWSDPFYWYMYKYAVAVPAIPFFAYNVANIIKSLYGKNKKVISLDLDNTLWGGIIGDDGVENIEIGQETPTGQSFSEFQQYLKQHKQLGVLLTVNSKNNMETALSGLKRPDSILREEDFIVFKANWNPKSDNLLETASELNLLPDSFVFVDDNPAERENVYGQINGVAVPELTEPEYYIKEMDRAGYFEATHLSEDDFDRTEMYRNNMIRIKEQTSYLQYSDYLQSLEMKAEIRHFVPEYISRITQLTNKSNQFNLTTRRYNYSEIEAKANDRGYITLYGKLEDKFGDNGVVSIIIGQKQKKELHVELWLMSCRVLKRDMEYAMMDVLVSECRKNNIEKIVGYYYPTAKNSMVKDFYACLGFAKISQDEKGNTTWEYPIAEEYQKKNTVIKIINEEECVCE